MLQDKAQNVRKAAIRLLSEIEDKRALSPLLKMLEDENSEVRKAAIKAIVALEGKNAVDIIIKSLGDTDPGVRQTAANCLETLDEPLGLLVYNALEGSQKALIEIGKIKDPRAVTPLINVLLDKNLFVRRMGAQALGKIGNKPATDRLIKLAGSWNPIDRFYGSIALLKSNRAKFDKLLLFFKVLTTRQSIIYCLFLLLMCIGIVKYLKVRGVF
jgi:HEAT repeat protein